jgi:predicted peptidase
MALAALAKTLDEFPVDQDRIYLTGLSMGGHGTWYLAYRNPERFAAVAPICGWTWGRPEGEFPAPVVPVEDGAPLPALARRLAGTPLWLFHGALDSVVPARGSREPAEALKAVSANVHYTEYLGLDHNSWDAAYGSEEFVRWLLAQRRRGH